MKLSEIKKAVDQNKKVCWVSDVYRVEKWHSNEYMITCVLNDNSIGLTHKDNVTLNGNENEFYINNN